MYEDVFGQKSNRTPKCGTNILHFHLIDEITNETTEIDTTRHNHQLYDAGIPKLHVPMIILTILDSLVYLRYAHPLGLSYEVDCTMQYVP